MSGQSLLRTHFLPARVITNCSVIAEPLWLHRKRRDMIEFWGARLPLPVKQTNGAPQSASDDPDVPLSPHVKRATEIAENDGHIPLASDASLAAIHALFDKWLVLADGERRYDQIDIAMAVIVANRLPSNGQVLRLLDNRSAMHSVSRPQRAFSGVPR